MSEASADSKAIHVMDASIGRKRDPKGYQEVGILFIARATLIVSRIKTQSALVQVSEHELAQKEQHCEYEIKSTHLVGMLTLTDANVMLAFQSAMSLLSRPS